MSYCDVCGGRVKSMYTNISSGTSGHMGCVLMGNATEVVQLKTDELNRFKELEDILRDLLTTKEDPRTWVEEMRGTISDVLGAE